MSASHTTERIRKQLAKGLTPEQVARKIGRPNAEGVARVMDETTVSRTCAMGVHGNCPVVFEDGSKCSCECHRLEEGKT